MRSQPIGKRVFASHGNVIGQFVGEFVTPATWPMLAGTGLDFGVVDMEHGGLTYREVANALIGARQTDLPAFVRVPELSRSAITRVLDLGADGVYVPHIENERDAAQLVSWAKYFPLGERSAMSSSIDPEAANAGVACIPIVESPAGADAIEAICATPGIDAVAVGPTDLSLLLGVYTEWESETFLATERRVIAACRAAGIPVGTGTGTPESAIAMLGHGYDWVVLGSEVAVFRHALTEAAAKIRGAFAPPAGAAD